jgi:hypothetical protein
VPALPSHRSPGCQRPIDMGRLPHVPQGFACLREVTGSARQPYSSGPRVDPGDWSADPHGVPGNSHAGPHVDLDGSRADPGAALSQASGPRLSLQRLVFPCQLRPPTPSIQNALPPCLRNTGGKRYQVDRLRDITLRTPVLKRLRERKDASVSQGVVFVARHEHANCAARDRPAARAQRAATPPRRRVRR